MALNRLKSCVPAIRQIQIKEYRSGASPKNCKKVQSSGGRAYALNEKGEVLALDGREIRYRQDPYKYYYDFESECLVNVFYKFKIITKDQRDKHIAWLKVCHKAGHLINDFTYLRRQAKRIGISLTRKQISEVNKKIRAAKATATAIK